jgi:hypothetical protein
MSVFHHPHLTRGIVSTPKGSFVIVRGLVEAPDEVGESLGWRLADLENEAQPALAPATRDLMLPANDGRVTSRLSTLRNTESRKARGHLIKKKAATLRSRTHVQPSE